MGRRQTIVKKYAPMPITLSTNPETNTTLSAPKLAG
jgi:hypothetical protein